MGHVVMPSFAFRTALSEDGGVRSGFALTEAGMLAQLQVNGPLRSGLTDNKVICVSALDCS